MEQTSLLLCPREADIRAYLQRSTKQKSLTHDRPCMLWTESARIRHKGKRCHIRRVIYSLYNPNITPHKLKNSLIFASCKEDRCIEPTHLYAECKTDPVHVQTQKKRKRDAAEPAPHIDLDAIVARAEHLMQEMYTTLERIDETSKKLPKSCSLGELLRVEQEAMTDPKLVEEAKRLGLPPPRLQSDLVFFAFERPKTHI